MKALLFGAGTYGSVYLSYLKGENINIVGILDDNKELHNSEIDGIKILGGIDLLEELYKKDIADAIYCPIGNNELRVQILEKARRIGYNIPNYIHKSVIISPNVKLGNGVYILLGSCIMPYSVIDDYVMISMGVNIAHHTILSKGVFLSTGNNIGASLLLEDNVYCGMSVTIVTGVKKIGKNSLIGAGAVVLKDVDSNSIMAGIPAKLLRYKK